MEKIPMADALLSIARQTGTTIAFDPSLVAAYTASPVHGKLTAQQALLAVLQGTDLEVQAISNGAYTIAKKISPEKSSGARTADKDQGSVATELPPVVVQAERLERGYAADGTRSATRSDTPMLELAQSVSTVSRELMDDQQSVSVMDALRNVSGVNQDSVATGPFEGISVRGFTVENAMSDGMMSKGTMAFSTPLIALDSIEVIKGPDGIVGGSAAKFGGVINLVSKKPQAETYREFQTTIDSEGKSQLGLDLTGALNQTKELRGRVILSTEQDGKSELGWNGGRNYYFAPSIAWKDSVDSLLVGAQFQSQLRAYGNYAYTTKTYLDQNLPTVSHANDDGFRYQTNRYYVDYERNLGSAWKLGLRGQYEKQNVNGSFWQQAGTTYPTGSSLMTLAALQERMAYRTSTYQADISKHLDLGPTEHRLLAGVDYFQTRTVTDLGYAYDQSLVSFTNSGSSLTLPSVDSLPNSFAVIDGGRAAHIETGLFLQDQIAIGKSWNALLSGRRVSYREQLGSTAPATSKWLPSVGLVYKVTPEISTYASYSEGVSNNSSYPTTSGSALPPVQAKQSEIGGKFAFFNERLMLTTALFRIQKTNVPTVDADNPAFYHVTAGEKSRGAEIELKGRLTRALNLSTAYTYTQASDDDGGPVAGVSKHTINVWSNYRFLEGALEGWTIGGGIVARGATYENNSTYNYAFHNPGQARVDTMLAYDADSWRVNFGIRNLTDRRLYTSGSSIAYVEVEPRRTFTTTVSVKF
jgi:iron complex outermembrane receptor protein